jgi:uncharacterized protein YjbI with pentapeptide repeats
VQRIGISNPISPPPTASYAREQLSQHQKTAQEQIKQQQQAAQALLISNQVSKGFELLAGPEIEKRLGGIYALEAVMNNSEQPQYHQPLLEALCAFVRDKAKHRALALDRRPVHQPLRRGQPIRRRPDRPPPAEPITTDVQAALTVIGRRVAGKGRVDLIGLNLSRASLSDANLSDANLSGADLSDAFLGRANLSDADLSGADLTIANLIGADLSDARLDGQTQLDQACGTDIKGLPLGLALNKPCPPPQ